MGMEIEEFAGEDQKAVGRRLVITRKALGKRGIDFSQEFGWSQQKISSWERGVNFPPHWEMVKLSRRYGVSLDWIYLANMAQLPLHLGTEIRKVIGATETAKSLYRASPKRKKQSNACQ